MRPTPPLINIRFLFLLMIAGPAFCIYPTLTLQAASPTVSARATVDFDRDIRPILSDVCFQCHGPDEQQRQTDLRLDVRSSIFSDLGDYRAIVPGRPEQSELYRRITATDNDERMPPPESKQQLSASQIELISTWIREGADWKEHWAFVRPARPRLPRVPVEWTTHNAIDHFVWARLVRAGLSPSAMASKATLVRRLSLDLTGLPPTPDEVTAFLEDQSHEAYGRLVDRLLSSPRFGERMALPWLDAARYADTSGYQNDGPRYMWRWRDWVIDALNANMPFDQFTVEQLAGDLLPEATLEQQIATGFNRNHRGNAEGGIIPAEYAVEYVVDRVETTSTVWLGLTLGCARCHDHKFDPVSQREFYQFFAFFNNVPEFGRAIKEGNSPPFIKAPTARQTELIEELDEEIKAAESRFEGMQAELLEAQMLWEASESTAATNWTPARALVARFPLDKRPSEIASPELTFKSGKVGSAAHFDGSAPLDVGDVADFGYFDKFSISAWIYPQNASASEQQSIVSRVTDAARATGYSVTWRDGRIHVNLVKRWLDDSIRVHTTQRMPSDEWTHVCVTYDGTRRAAGVAVYVNGQLEPVEVELDLLNQSFRTDQPLRIGGGGGTESNFIGLIDDVHVYERPLSSTEVSLLATPDRVSQIKRLDPLARSVAQRQKLHAYYLDQLAPLRIRRAYQQLVEIRERRQALWEAVPTVMVMQESDPPKKTFVLHRGQYDQPQDEVVPLTPSCLPPLPEEASANRLSLARWIVDPLHPLTARVAVNRYWQMLFGRGLVETPEDFGAQGMRPSHPELLDWLATEFVHSGWDVKSLLKTMVSSATYRQASHSTQELLARDPQNRLLARGPRFRMRAELIRDQALAASGLLVEQLSGPSVRPYQPEGLWKEIASDTDYDQSTGASLYRRSLYSYWKRTVAPPAMTTFDASTRETCVVRPTRTNTPLQALTLMNDVTFLEASRALAQRVLRRRTTPEERLSEAFELAVGRKPNHAELGVLVAGLRYHLATYRGDLPAAKELVRAGNLELASELNVADVAAYMVVSSMLLNLDETVTKE